MGRFLTRDTWPGEVNRPLSLNRWGYVEGNPINYTDPTGHVLCGTDCIIQGAIQINAPEVLMYDETQAPKNITFSGSPLTPPRIIYNRNCLDERVVPPGTDQSQFIPSRCEPTWPLDRNRHGTITYHSGLCGQISIAAILAGLIPGVTANDVVDNFMKHRPGFAPDYTGVNELKKFINEYYGGYLYAWEAERAKFRDENPLIQKLRHSLNGGYVIAGIRVSASTGQLRNGVVDSRAPNRSFGTTGAAMHWVVITGVSNEWNLGGNWRWIRIYNPFGNQTEYYWWGDFQSSWESDQGVMLRISIFKGKDMLR
jgi:hypothetical protein